MTQITFESLIAQHTRRPATKSKPVKSPPVVRKLRDIQADDRLAVTHDPNVASALVLVTVKTTCEKCGRIYSSPNSNCLVRYDNNGLSHSVKRHLNETHQFASLPKEHKTYHQTAPFCSECF